MGRQCSSVEGTRCSPVCDLSSRLDDSIRKIQPDQHGLPSQITAGRTNGLRAITIIFRMQCQISSGGVMNEIPGQHGVGIDVIIVPLNTSVLPSPCRSFRITSYR